MFEDKYFSETEMMVKAIKAAKEWQNSLPPRKQPSVSSKDCQTSSLPPQVPTNASMLFSDAAWNSSTLAGGLSWVCQDSIGTHLFQGTENRRYIASALVAEALALRTGNKSVISLRGILHDLGVLSKSFNSISFQFISRVCNVQADSLAKNSLFQYSNNLSEIGNNVSV